MVDALERPEDAGSGDKGLAEYWFLELDLASKAESEWRKRAWRCVEKYRDEKSKRRGKRLNIFWSNVETLKPAVLSAIPEPDVRRRYLDRDPVARTAAEAIERSLGFCLDDYPVAETLEQARDDMLITGRGVWRVTLESEVTTLPAPVGGMEDLEIIGEQSVKAEYIFWDDLRLFPAAARTWADVYAIAIRHEMTRDQLVDEFGQIGREVTLTLSSDLTEERSNNRNREHGADEALKTGEVWEIWDKREKERIWLSKKGDDGIILDNEDDPLSLSDFFPIIPPLYAVKTTDTMVPVPEYTIYQDQADELDKITQRITRLIMALKVSGIYAASLQKMQEVIDNPDNTLAPVTDWEMIAEKGGLEKMVHYLPIDRIGQVLAGLYNQRELLVREIQEITGISDIIRGQTKASETATAQRLKGNFGTFRMVPRRVPMERAIAKTYEMKAEIIAEHFTQENIRKMTGMDITDEIMDFLRNQGARAARINVESESTVQPNADQQRQEAVEFSKASTEFLAGMTQLASANPTLLPLLVENYKVVVRRFKGGRQLEDVIEQTMDRLMQAAQQSQGRDDPGRVLAAREQARKEVETDVKQQEQQRKGVETAHRIANENTENIMRGAQLQ